MGIAVYGDFSTCHCCTALPLQYNHPDLAPNLVPMTAEWQRSNYDDNLHGTHVAGIIGAVSAGARA